MPATAAFKVLAKEGDRSIPRAGGSGKKELEARTSARQKGSYLQKTSAGLEM